MIESNCNIVLIFDSGKIIFYPMNKICKRKKYNISIINRPEPVKQETVYTLDYSPENVKMLFQKSWNGKNLFFKPDKRSNRRVMFIVKDESSETANEAIEVYWQSIERSLELMKTKSGEELFNGSYLPSAVKKEERIRLSQGLTGEFNR